MSSTATKVAPSQFQKNKRQTFGKIGVKDNRSPVYVPEATEGSQRADLRHDNGWAALATHYAKGIASIVIIAIGLAFPHGSTANMVAEQNRATTPFRFEDFDEFPSDQEALDAALAALLKRYPIGSDVDALTEMISVGEKDRFGRCEDRKTYEDGTKAIFCQYGHRWTKDPVNWQVWWWIPVRISVETNQIVMIKLKSRLVSLR